LYDVKHLLKKRLFFEQRASIAVFRLKFVNETRKILHSLKMPVDISLRGVYDKGKKDCRTSYNPKHCHE